MREILFRGKSVLTKEWIYGDFHHGGIDKETGERITFIKPFDKFLQEVIPETVGECTGLREFVIADKSFMTLLFENDIVEVWGHRRPSNENYPVSKYDCECKIRGVIIYKQGKWRLDFDNDYNHTIEKLRGNEQNERTVAAFDSLCHYGYHGKNEEWHREHNSYYKWEDIQRIGNIFDNLDLLKGGAEK